MLTLGTRLLERIPLIKTVYSGIHDLMLFVSRAPDDDRRHVVLVTLPGDIRPIGFITDTAPAQAVPELSREDEPVLAVYLPMSWHEPSPHGQACPRKPHDLKVPGVLLRFARRILDASQEAGMQPSDHIRLIGRQWVLAIAVLGMNAIAGVVAAQSPRQEAPPSEPANVTSSWVERIPLPIQPAGLPPEDAPGLCEDKPGGLTWIDRAQAGLYRTICLSAARFDGFFGNARFDDEYQATHGRLAVGALWDERDHWDPRVRFRVHVRLPQLSERVNAFVGRLDPDEYVTELRDDFYTLPRQFAREDDDAVLFGLGYRQPGRIGGHFDAGIGAKLGSPVDPYVKGTYRLGVPFRDRNLIRLHETIFWQVGEGFGATTRFDLERLLSEDFLVRWTGSGRFTERTEGVRWFSSLTLYQNLGGGRAFAYEAGISGETDREVAVADYGLRAIYRHRIHLEWLFLELRSGITWPRETLTERREPNWSAGIALEMLFGERTTR
jgi:hypothetical protein